MTPFPLDFPPAADEMDVLRLTRQRENSIAAAASIAATIAGTPSGQFGDHRQFADRMLDEIGVTDPAERTPLIGVILSALAEGNADGK